MRAYIGIDNGVTGTIGFISESFIDFFNTPIRKELNYTKTKKYVTRIDHEKLYQTLQELMFAAKETQFLVVLERPMVNPQRWEATLSALRSLESTLIVFERLNLSYQFIDSKEWQGAMLPKGVKKEELKKAGINVASRLYPKLKGKFKPDADGLLIAEYARRKRL